MLGTGLPMTAKLGKAIDGHLDHLDSVMQGGVATLERLVSARGARPRLRDERQ